MCLHEDATREINYSAKTCVCMKMLRERSTTQLKHVFVWRCYERDQLLSSSRRFRILARKIEFGVFGLFRMRKTIFSWKNRILMNFHIISAYNSEISSELSEWDRKKIRNCPNRPLKKKSELSELTSEKNSELSEYSEKKFWIVRIDLGKKFWIPN